MNSLLLPPKGAGKPNENWADVQAVVITGANGSGKTRFGVWIEENNPSRQVHRIAAQRALQLPDLVTPMPYERAASQLYYGSYDPNWNEQQHRQSKLQRRWGGQPVNATAYKGHRGLELFALARGRGLKPMWRRRMW